MFAAPCPQVSRVLEDGVSVMSSTSLAVSSDSSSPTTAMDRAYGKITCSVSNVQGTSGSPSTGSSRGSSPLSPTVGTAIEASTARRVTTTTAASGDGTARLSRGRPKVISRPRATSG